MNGDDDLERMERALDAVSLRLAARRPWEEVAPRIRRRLHGPLWRLAGWTVFMAALAAVALRHDELWVVVAFVGLVVLPGEVQAALERRRSLVGGDSCELLDVYEAELRRLQARQVTRFVVDPIVVLGLLVLMVLARWPLVPALLAAALVLRVALTAWLWLPRTRRELIALGDDDEPLDVGEPNDAEDAEDPDEADEPWPSLVLGLFVAYVQVFLLYLGPPFAVVSGIVAWRADSPTGPAVVSVALAIGATLAWWRVPDRPENPR